MILKGRDIDGFLAAPRPEVLAVLFYGPDAGRVSERAKGLVTKVAGDSEDPFAVVELNRREIAEDPRRLADELSAIPMSGGRPVVRLRDAGDDTAGHLADGIPLEGDSGLLVVEAGDLPPRSALRKLFEGHDRAAAIACYLDDERSLPALIKSVLAESNLTATADALALLVRSMGADRLVTRQELDKLVHYMGGSTDGDGNRREVALEDVRACVGDSAEVTLDDLAFAVAAGDMARLEMSLERAQSTGAQPVSLLRAVSRHFQRLHQAAAALAEGQPLEKAVSGVRPPVFWKLKSAFSGQVQAWGDVRLSAALVELTDCETDVKTGGAPQDLLVQRALLRLAANAPRSGRR